MEWSSEVRAWIFTRSAIAPVSILVLMEWSSEGADGKLDGRAQKGFNPCSDGMIFWGRPERDCEQHHNVFQSLFWWNDLLRKIARHKTNWIEFCFNPCSDGMIFWGIIDSRIGFTTTRFNPCSDGMIFWGVSRTSSYIYGSTVSILVLMEWSSEARSSNIKAQMRQVSILVLMEWSSEAHLKSRG